MHARCEAEKTDISCEKILITNPCYGNITIWEGPWPCGPLGSTPKWYKNAPNAEVKLMGGGGGWV